MSAPTRLTSHQTGGGLLLAPEPAVPGTVGAVVHSEASAASTHSAVRQQNAAGGRIDAALPAGMVHYFPSVLQSSTVSSLGCVDRGSCAAAAVAALFRAVPTAAATPAR